MIPRHRKARLTAIIHFPFQFSETTDSKQSSFINMRIMAGFTETFNIPHKFLGASYDMRTESKFLQERTANAKIA